MKIYVGLLMSCLFMMSSCEKMEEVHQKYIPNGETIYRVKPSNIVAYSGNKRTKLQWELSYPNLVTKCEIKEGDKLLAEIPVTYNDLVKLEHTLTDLEEKTYTLSLYSRDDYGNSSIKSNIVVEIFGEKYLKTLKTTTSINTVWRRVDNTQTAYISLSERLSSKIISTAINYKDVDGNKQTVMVDAANTSVEIENVATDSYFHLQDVYKPNSTCIDQFTAPAKEYTDKELPLEGSRTFTLAYKTDATTLYAKLSSGVGGTLRTLIKYGNTEVEVSPDQNEVTLKDVTADVITIETVMKVADSATEYLTVNRVVKTTDLLTRAEMNNWEVIEISSYQENEGPINAVIDGNLSTIWHTMYSPNQPSYPHFVVVDMKNGMTVKAIAVARRNGNNSFASKFLLEMSNDGENWTKADEFCPNNTIDGLQIFTLKAPATGRYFKLTGLESASGNAFMCMSEIQLFK